MILIQFVAAFIGVIAFSVNLEIPKKYIIITGLVGAIGWIVYLICIKLDISNILSYFISDLTIAILSIILSKLLKAISTIFLIPGILPIVPGIAMYELIYYILNNDWHQAKYYLVQVILITGGIALAVFVADSIKEIKIMRKESKSEN